MSRKDADTKTIDNDDEIDHNVLEPLMAADGKLAEYFQAISANDNNETLRSLWKKYKNKDEVSRTQEFKHTATYTPREEEYIVVDKNEGAPQNDKQKFKSLYDQGRYDELVVVNESRLKPDVSLLAAMTALVNQCWECGYLGPLKRWQDQLPKLTGFTPTQIVEETRQLHLLYQTLVDDVLRKFDFIKEMISGGYVVGDPYPAYERIKSMSAHDGGHLKKPSADSEQEFKREVKDEQSQVDLASMRSSIDDDEYDAVVANYAKHLIYNQDNPDFMLLYLKAQGLLGVELFEQFDHVSFVLYALQQIKQCKETIFKDNKDDIEEIQDEIVGELIGKIEGKDRNFFREHIKPRFDSQFAHRNLDEFTPFCARLSQIVAISSADTQSASTAPNSSLDNAQERAQENKQENPSESDATSAVSITVAPAAAETSSSSSFSSGSSRSFKLPKTASASSSTSVTSSNSEHDSSSSTTSNSGIVITQGKS